MTTFVIALIIVLAIGLWPRLRQKKRYKQPDKEIDNLKKFRRTNLRRIK